MLLSYPKYYYFNYNELDKQILHSCQYKKMHLPIRPPRPPWGLLGDGLMMMMWMMGTGRFD